MNITIGRYAYASMTPTNTGHIECWAADIEKRDRFPLDGSENISDGLKLHRATIKRIIQDYGPLPVNGLKRVTHVNTPIGSGLGSSSALMVALVQCLSALYGGLLDTLLKAAISAVLSPIREGPQRVYIRLTLFFTYIALCRIRSSRLAVLWRGSTVRRTTLIVLRMT